MLQNLEMHEKEMSRMLLKLGNGFKIKFQNCIKIMQSVPLSNYPMFPILHNS